MKHLSTLYNENQHYADTDKTNHVAKGQLGS